MCLNIATDGNVTMPYVVKTSEIMVGIIRALTVEQITIDDNVTISRNLVVNGVFNYSSSNVAYTTPVDTNLGQIYVNGANGNYIGFNQTCLSNPTAGTRSVGTKLFNVSTTYH